MTNHVDIIATLGEPSNLGKAISEPHKNYTRMMNQKQKWTGYLWQERYSFSMRKDEGKLTFVSPYLFIFMLFGCSNAWAYSETSTTNTNATKQEIAIKKQYLCPVKTPSVKEQQAGDYSSLTKVACAGGFVSRINYLGGAAEYNATEKYFIFRQGRLSSGYQYTWENAYINTKDAEKGGKVVEYIFDFEKNSFNTRAGYNPWNEKARNKLENQAYQPMNVSATEIVHETERSVDHILYLMHTDGTFDYVFETVQEAPYFGGYLLMLRTVSGFREKIVVLQKDAFIMRLIEHKIASGEAIKISWKEKEINGQVHKVYAAEE